MPLQQQFNRDNLSSSVQQPDSPMQLSVCQDMQDKQHPASWDQSCQVVLRAVQTADHGNIRRSQSGPLIFIPRIVSSVSPVLWPRNSMPNILWNTIQYVVLFSCVPYSNNGYWTPTLATFHNEHHLLNSWQFRTSCCESLIIPLNASPLTRGRNASITNLALFSLTVEHYRIHSLLTLL